MRLQTVGVTVVLRRRGEERGLHIYGSVQGEAGGGGSEQRAGLLHRGSARDDCGGPMTMGGAEVRGTTGRRKEEEDRGLQLLRDFECWMSHCSVMSAGERNI